MAKRGLKAVTIISGGFKEVGEGGADIEQECVKVARKYDMRLIGAELCRDNGYLQRVEYNLH